MALTFPVIQVSADSISTFHDEESFRQAVSLTTDKAINAGFFKKARWFDSNLVEHRIEQLELSGTASLLGWMKRGREIKVMKIAAQGGLDLPQVKTLLSTTIKSSTFWAENEDVDAIVRDVEAAQTFAALAALFG
jgi:hypothetical protein